MTDNEILNLILEKVTSLESDMKEVKQDVADLKQDMKEVKQDITEIKLTIENEIRVNIQRVA